MKSILVSIVAAVVLVGCGESQQSAPKHHPEIPDSKASTAKAPDISLFNAAAKGNIEAVKQHLAAGTDVNAKYHRNTILYVATINIDRISCDGLTFYCSVYLSLMWNHQH